jgi:hypothetical protein
VEGAALSGTISNLLHLQRAAGNAAVAALMMASAEAPVVQRKLRPWVAEQVNHVVTGLGDGSWGSPQGPWWWLNGYGTQDLIDVLTALGSAHRKALIAHLAEADGYDRPRLEGALRSVQSGASVSGKRALDIVDSIRNAISTKVPFTDAFAKLAALHGSARLAVLRRIDRADLRLLLDHIEEAPMIAQPSLEGSLNELLAPPASSIKLDFIPDEKETVSSKGNLIPLGTIHVFVKGTEIEAIDARGGPWLHLKDRGHSIDPSRPGTYKVGAGAAVVTSWWEFSQLADGTPLREVTAKDGSVDVQYKRDGNWHSTLRLAMPLERDAIIDAEIQYGRLAKIPKEWDLNDFGKEGFHVGDTDMFIHTTPDTEDEYAAKMPEKLTFSHGCIHIKPSDREHLIKEGWLRAGVTIKIHAYDPARLSRWGKPPP